MHLHDMVILASMHPSVYRHFLAGNFTVKKTTRAVSVIAIAQVHEQNNASVKGDGDTIGLTENPAALQDGWCGVWSIDGLMDGVWSIDGQSD